jgi:hypothetical protein
MAESTPVQSWGIIFTHIPKTAGSSIHDVLKHQLLDGSYVRTPLTWRDRRRRFRGVGGHFFHDRHPEEVLLPGLDYRHVTLLRRPLDRVMSFYRYVTTVRRHYLLDLARKRGVDLRRASAYDFVRFCQDIDSVEISDLQTKKLCGSPVRYTAAEAAAVLENDYAAFGLVEEMAKFAARLETVFGRRVFIPRINMSTRHPAAGDRPAEALIEQLNQADLELYERCQRLIADQPAAADQQIAPPPQHFFYGGRLFRVSLQRLLGSVRR